MNTFPVRLAPHPLGRPAWHRVALVPATLLLLTAVLLLLGPIQARATTTLDTALSASHGGDSDFLPPDEAFRFSATADGPDKIRLTWGITNGYYLYRSRMKVASDPGKAELGQLVLPTGDTKTDDYFGKQEVYHHDVVGILAVARAGGGPLEVPIKVTYQGCAAAGLCYPPITKSVNVLLPPAGGAAASGSTSLGRSATATTNGTPTSSPAAGGTLPSASGLTGSDSAAAGRDTHDASTASASVNAPANPRFVSEQDQLAALIRDGNLFAVLATFFGIGVLLSLTPCVLPMIPILSGIIVGQGQKVTAGRGFSLAFAYVQGMAVTYSLAGAVFVLAFKQAPQAFFQQPWIVALFVILFIALALSMFGAYTIQLPSALQTKLTSVSNQQRSGTYVGSFIMGALSALVVTACVAPALIAALSVISETGRIARGAAALYATGLGMGLPLLIVGASAGSLLPKVGPWMETVKSLFGVLFLALAIYFLQPLLPAAGGMLLWSALAVIAGFWVFALKGRDGGPAPAALRAFGLMAVVYGIILLIGVAAGSNDPLQPLDKLRAANSDAGAQKQATLAFDTIKSLDDLNKRVAAASAAGRPVMLDFYADWCTSCKEMERYTFSDRQVQAALSDAVLLHADVTKNDATDQELLKHFDIFGPPTIAFYGPNGEERRNFRVVGYMQAADFASLARRAFAPNLSASSATTAGTK